MATEAKVDTMVEELRKRILAKEYGTAGRLPPVRMLADLFRVSREVIDRALQRLQAEGLVVSYGTAGMYVNLPQARISGVIPSFGLDLGPVGEPLVQVNLEEPNVVSVSEEVTNALELEWSSPVIRRLRRQGTRRATYRVAEEFYPLIFAGNLLTEMVQADFDVVAAIQKAFDVPIQQVRDELIGRLPTLREQGWLNVVRNTPVIEVQRVGYVVFHHLPSRTPIVYCRLLYVAHHTRFVYEYPAPDME